MRDEDPTYELTMNVTKGTYTFVCREHGINRSGITTVQHAANIEAKHVREHHHGAEPQVNVTAAAQALVSLLADDPEDASALQRGQSLAVRVAAVEVLEALTGLHGLAAIARGQDWADTHPAITAHVAPF